MNQELKIQRLPGRKLGDYSLSACFRFSFAGNSMLLCRETGTTMFLSDELADSLSDGPISPELQYKLLSRGFASVPGSPAFVDCSETILPTFFLIDLTNGCNLGCCYCFRVPENQKQTISAEMVGKICQYILDYCTKHQISAITIQPWGGEPLLCIDKIVLIRKFFRQHPEVQVDICVETNGTLLTDENIRLLQDHQVRFSISVDGPPQLQDRQRPDRHGSPTSAIILQNLQRARKYGYRDLGGICILTDHSLGRVKEILQYLENTLEMRSIKLNLMRQPSYECKDVRALSQEEITAIANEMVDALTELRRSGSKMRESTTGDRLSNLLNKKNRNICNSSGCCGGRRMVSFDLNGNIYPCELTDWPDEQMGNIQDGTDLCGIVEQAAATKPYFQPKHIDECDECPWWFYCRGGCSSAVKYRRLQPPCVDASECQLNKSLYPLLVKKILSGEAEREGWL